MSNVLMETHSMVFVTIDKLVSPSSSVNWNPLDDFPDHWQPRFSAEFFFPGTGGGALWPAPPYRKKWGLAASNTRAAKQWGLLSRGWPCREQMCTLVRWVTLT